VRFALYECPDGVETPSAGDVVYDLVRDRAARGPGRFDGPRVLWSLGEPEGSLVTKCHKGGLALEADVHLDPVAGWLVRCDRVDFPPGGVAYRHVHPGPGIRRILHGELTIDAEGEAHTYGPGEAWFEGADYPVLATASPTEETAFVRLLLLPREWEGKRTIRYLDPADEEKPKLQRATIFLEQPLAP
jgi:quercetin dioxygenase-like cupin family protein